MVQSVTLSFMQSAIVGQSEDLKKKLIIWLKFCSKSGGYLCLCVSLCLCVVARTYISTYVCVCTDMYLYIFTHISAVCW